MFDLDKWQEIYHSISKHKLRTALTAFGVFWGIFMLVLLLGAGKGLENGVLKGFGGYATNSLWVWTEKTSIPYKGLQPGRFLQMTNDDFYAVRKSVKNVKYICPRMNLWDEFVVTYRTNNGAFSVRGCYPDHKFIEPMEIPSGRFINTVDIIEKRKVAVIGQRVAEVLFKTEDPIGKFINIKGVYFKVIGTFKGKKANWEAKEDLQALYIPLSTLQVTYNKVNKIGWFGFVLEDKADAKKTLENLKDFFRKRHDVAPNDEQAVGGHSMEDEFKKFQGLFQAINIFVWVVGIGTIIAGIVGVSNIMLIIVKERTKEIGIRKAMGATPGSIVSLIIQESIVITSVAGYCGLIAGVALLEGLSYSMTKFNLESEFFYNPGVDFRVAISATLLLVVTGSLAGFIPASKAAKINPIQALKDE